MKIAKCLGIPGPGARLGGPPAVKGRCPQCSSLASEAIPRDGLVDLCVFCGNGVIYDGAGYPVILVTAAQLIEAVANRHEWED